jgi:hypothetical protein
VAAWANEDGREPVELLEELRREIVKRNLSRMAAGNRSKMDRLGLNSADGKCVEL